MTKEEAIKIVKEFINGTHLHMVDQEALETLIPELRESEDERIRKVLVNEISGWSDVYKMFKYAPKEKVLAWLEKHKELIDPFDTKLFQDGVKEGRRLEREDIEKEPIPIPGIFSGLKSLMLQYLQSATNRTHDTEIESDTDLWGRKILDYVWKYSEKQKEQKPILEVFGFKVGDAVRLKDGDGRKHIIKSFEEIEGLHGPSFYRVVFEDTASDYIFTGDKYSNGYYTQMEKFEEEQEPSPKFRVGDMMRTKQEAAEEITDGIPVVVSIDEDYYICNNEKIPITDQEEYEFPPMNTRQKPAEWSEEDEDKLYQIIETLLADKEIACRDNPQHYDVLCKAYDEQIAWLKSLRPQPQGTYKLIVHNVYEMLKDKDFFDIPPSHRVSLLNDIRVRCKNADEQAEILDIPSWKPSEEQMQYLLAVINDPNNAGAESCHLILESLYNDLKKL